MVFIIFKCFLRVFIGVAVFTAVHAGIISPYIPAFDTMAALPCAFMLQVLEQYAVGISKNSKRHTARRMDMIAGKIAVRPAGLNKNAVFSAIAPSPCASVSISCSDRGTSSGILLSSFLYISTKLKIQRSI